MSDQINIRTSFAFDAETVESVKELARHWGVSQSEAVRRSIKQARTATRTPYEGMSPYQVLQLCFETPLASAEEVQRRQREADEIRKSWREPRQT